MRNPFVLIAIIVLTGLLAAMGCQDDGVDWPDPGRYAQSPDEAVRLLRDAYLHIDIEQVDRVLHPHFTFQLSSDDVDTLGIDGEWDRVTELHWTGNLFAGKWGRRADGVLQAPIDPDFAFDGTVVAADGSAWEVDTETVPGAQRREYRTAWNCQFFPFDFDIVGGNQIFYVRQRVIDLGRGITTTAWQIVRWEDRGVASLRPKHETISWGRLRAKFRFDDIEPPTD